jgi:hypothetical protein
MVTDSYTGESSTMRLYRRIFCIVKLYSTVIDSYRLLQTQAYVLLYNSFLLEWLCERHTGIVGE